MAEVAPTHPFISPSDTTATAASSVRQACDCAETWRLPLHLARLRELPIPISPASNFQSEARVRFHSAQKILVRRLNWGQCVPWPLELAGLPVESLTLYFLRWGVSAGEFAGVTESHPQKHHDSWGFDRQGRSLGWVSVALRETRVAARGSDSPLTH